jgi:two-component system, OmpR family, sensor histidine kinase KdpD
LYVPPRLLLVLRLAASSALVAVITVVYTQFLPVNPTTVALTYLIGILLIASGWGIAESTTASLVAVACFNFFFLPPVGTFTIADPQNWVALVAFLVTATVASQLSDRARRRNVEALARQKDLERLYALSRSLLLSEGGTALPGGIARHIADAFELASVGLLDARTDSVSWAGERDMTTIDSRLREVARRAASTRDGGMVVTAIQLGGAPIGSIAIPDVGLSDTVLQSIANLAAIGLERARAEAATARAEAARASSELRATVLDALAHEFKTPLTSMKAASSDLLASASVSTRDRELVAVIDEDLDRFQALVTDAVQMLRIDAGDFVVHPGRHRLVDVVATVVRSAERRLDGHQLVSRVPDDLSVDADRDLLGLALRQLLDNALKYSPSTSTIEVTATRNGSVDISVRNSGSLIPEREQRRIFERFYRGGQAGHIPGTGMGLAIVQQIAQAHGGTLTVSSAPETGTTFTLSLPLGGYQT